MAPFTVAVATFSPTPMSEHIGLPSQMVNWVLDFLP